MLGLQGCVGQRGGSRQRAGGSLLQSGSVRRELTAIDPAPVSLQTNTALSARAAELLPGHNAHLRVFLCQCSDVFGETMNELLS